MQGAVAGAVQGAPDHVCHWAVQGCCPGCSGSCLPLGGARVLFRVLRIMFVIGWCQGGCCPVFSGSCLPLGGVWVLSRVLRIMFAIGWCEGAVQGAVRGAPDHVCHLAVSGLCRALSRVPCRGAVQGARIMFAIGRCQGAVQGAVEGAVQGAPDHVCHWAV